MRKIYFTLILIMGLKFLYAQDTTQLAGKMQFVFAQLNRNAISTGFLEERAFPLVSLTPFNGVLTDSNKVYLNALRATYFTQYSACMLSNNSMLPVDTINQRINQYLPATTAVPVAVHFGEFNSFKSYAATSNLVSIGADDVIHDVPNRTENPYLLRQLFTACPIKSEFENSNFSLVFKSNLFFTNTSLSVSALYIDFDDGQGYQAAAWNTEVSPTYYTAGEKNMRIKLVLSNSSQYECYAPITVKEVTILGRFSSSGPNHTEFFYATSNHSGGKAYVRYSSSNSTGHLKKPLIVVEGYDASLVAPNLAGDNYSYESFITSLNRVVDLGYDFNYQLDDIAGYDLVFIDYNYGTDYIERNASLFKDVLNWVNADKALGGSVQQNVVLGISMGGLVARYALADMTKNNQPTQTRLLITHDSPHQGANVPVGLQKVVQGMGQADMFGKKILDVFPQYNEVTAVLNEPATAQLLTYRSLQHNGSIQTNTWLAGTYKPMVTFAPSGPQPSYRFIATSQGSECGTPLFGAGAQLLNVQASGGAVVFFLPGFYSKFGAEIKANALPATGGSVELAKIKLEAKVKYLFVRVKKETFNFSYPLSSSPYLPIDGAPGGASPVGSTAISPQSFGGLIGIIFGAYVLNVNVGSLNTFTFVPTPSALDIQNYNQSSLNSTYVGGWNPLNPSSAETFIAQEAASGSFNESHTRFTARNAEWLYKQMENISSNTLNCSNICSQATNNSLINGPSQFCTTATYQIPNLPSGATVTWSATGSISISGSTTANPVSVSKSIDGTGTLTATVSTACGSFNLSKMINAGAPTLGMPSFTNLDNQNPYWCSNNSGNSFTVESNDLSSTYEARLLTYPSLNVYASNNNAYPGFDVFGYVPPGYYVFQLRATNACGTSAWVETEVESVYCTSDWESNNLNVYPNPVEETLTITYSSTEGMQAFKLSKTASEEKHLLLFDDKGKEVKKDMMKAGETKLEWDIKNFPSGRYFLHIKEGKEVVKKQIIIKH